MKQTSVRKINPNRLCNRPQDPKKQLGSFKKFTNGHYFASGSLRHYSQTLPFLPFLSEPAITWSGHPLLRLPVKTSFKYVNRKIRGHSPQC